jgi:hypothetical protein
VGEHELKLEMLPYKCEHEGTCPPQNTPRAGVGIADNFEGEGHLPPWKAIHEPMRSLRATRASAAGIIDCPARQT